MLLSSIDISIDLSNVFVNLCKQITIMGDIKIAIKIDCSKINKAKLFKGKNGAQWLDATVYLKDAEDQYGNRGMITQDKTKDVSGNGKNIILGNIKVWNNDGGFNNERPSDAYTPTEEVPNDNGDLPF